MKRPNKKVLVGMSGGVDSSLTAALLVEQGHDVTGGFIKNWSDTVDLWTGECSWRHERRDALRVAAKLGIPLLTFDFEKQYRKLVVDEMLAAYAAGRTPNPDVLCNEFIKFGLFHAAAKRLGFDHVATGHYARVKLDRFGKTRLYRGLDPDKDQSYFLYRVSQDALRDTLFPIGGYRKSQVRRMAKSRKLPVADKPDSQGICFIGKLDLPSFLRKKIKPKPGEIVGPDGEAIGTHDGLDTYTIGQRQRIKVSEGGHAWYVAGKDIKANRLIVVPSEDHPLLCKKAAILHDVKWISGSVPRMPFQGDVQVRYRQKPVQATVRKGKTKNLELDFKQPVKAVAQGQSAVIYAGQECLGGGVIA